MRFLYKGKDGGSESPVTGYWLIEIKSLFSIVLLKFNKGRRENFHSHAFNALTWFLKGNLVEERILSNHGILRTLKGYKKSIFPKLTTRENLHRVKAYEDSWCISIRGPWKNEWKEYNEKSEKIITLTHGRLIVNEEKI